MCSIEGYRPGPYFINVQGWSGESSLSSNNVAFFITVLFVFRVDDETQLFRFISSNGTSKLLFYHFCLLVYDSDTVFL